MFILLKIKIKTLAITIALLCYISDSFADTPIEFNTDVLDIADRQNVDLGRFAQSNYISPGKYLLDIRLNGEPLQQQEIQYVIAPGDVGHTLVCMTTEQVALLTLKKEAEEKIRKIADNCFDITVLPGIKMDNREGYLNITVPQAWMKYTAKNWVPPERWDNGIAGVVFDYGLTGYFSRQLQGSRESSNSVSAYGQAGMNVGAWRMRGNYQANYDTTRHKSQVDWNQFYLFRPLPMLAAKFTAGETYLNSEIFDNFRYTGMNLTSDERMLPPNLRGYAPEIRGIAKTNAKVTVSQEGRTVYETTVPAGPFTLQDLSSAVQGKLDVRIEEQNGEVSGFQVNTASIPYLTRPGYLRYNISAGKPSDNTHNTEGPVFYSADFSWGAGNAWSLYGGALLTGKEYNAWSLGLGRDLDFLGALSADVTQATSKIPGEAMQKGVSFRLSYAKTFDEYHSAITFAGYRFSQNNFRTMQQYLDERYENSGNNGREREMYTLTGSKVFWADDPRWLISLYLNYTHQTYWNSAAQDSYGLSVGKTFDVMGIKGISASLSAYRSIYNSQTDDNIALSFSVPVGDNRSIGLDIQNTREGTTTMASWSDYYDNNNLWRARVGADAQSRTSADGYYSHRSTLADISANIGYQQSQSLTLGGTLRGGFTATAKGAAMHNGSGMQNAARIVVDTEGVADVPLNHQRARTNRFGIAVLPDVMSYNSVDTRIDVDAMAENVDAQRAIATTTLTEGAIGYQQMIVTQGSRLMSVLRLRDGSFPPFGAEIRSAHGVSVAMVMEEGEAWLAGIAPGETLSVLWGGKPQCRIHVPEKLTPNSNSGNTLLPCE